MATTIRYSLTPVSEEFTGSNKVCRANVQTNGTVESDELAAKLADPHGQRDQGCVVTA